MIPFLSRIPIWLRWALGFGLLVFIIAQGVEYFTGEQARSHLKKQQDAAKASRIEQNKASQKAQTAYQIDSATQALHRAQLHYLDSALAAQEHEISTSRPARVPLPAEPPRYQPGN
jgi:hypothetical protein